MNPTWLQSGLGLGFTLVRYNYHLVSKPKSSVWWCSLKVLMLQETVPVLELY